MGGNLLEIRPVSTAKMDGQFNGLSGAGNVGCGCGKGVREQCHGSGGSVFVRVELNGDVLAPRNHLAPVVRGQQLACACQARLLIGHDEAQGIVAAEGNDWVAHGTTAATAIPERISAARMVRALDKAPGESP